jgi:uncharacterized beta barrel domain-containing protein DUF5777
MRTGIWIAAAFLFAPLVVVAQPSWQPSAPPSEPPVELFRSVMTANYPTTEMLGRGDFHYEISHRFHPPIDAGYDANFGFDGPASMRTALGYGVTDQAMVTLGRSSVLDNLDLQVKYRVWQRQDEVLPLALAVNVGLAWSTDLPAIVDRGKLDADNLQYYTQLVANALLLDGKLALGLTPSYLYNSAIFSVDTQYTLTLGTYGHYYLNDTWGVWAEYSPVLAGYQGVLMPGEIGRSHDSLSLGLSIETGGHFFYLFTTNNTRLNPALYLAGAAEKISLGSLRVAFGITRYL